MRERRSWLAVVLVLLLVGLTSAQAQVADYSLAASRVAEKLLQAFPKVRGLIVSVEQQGKLVLDLTAQDGIYPGMEMEVFREGEAFKHPVSGEVMGRMEKTVGLVRVGEVRDRFSVGQLLEQEGSVKAGDGVRVTGARILLGLAKVEAPPGADVAARAFTRELELALQKTGRFEVFDDRMTRSTVVKGGLKEGTRITDPAALEVLRRDLRLSAVCLAKLGAGGAGGQVVDVELVSTRTGFPLTVVSTDVPVGVAQAPTEPLPAKPATQAPKPSPTPGGPAWIGPPTSEGAPNPHFTANPLLQSPRRTSGPRTYYIQPVPAGLKRIAFADIDGDGQDEMVGITDNEVVTFQWTEDHFKLYRRYAKPQGANFLLVDAADINGNGRAEIFVTDVDERPGTVGLYHVALRSFVLELKGESLVPIWEDVPLYFRVIRYPGHPEGILVTQPLGKYKAFQDPVRRYVSNGTAYVPDPAWEFPSGLELDTFTLVDLNGDGREEFVVIGYDGQVRVWSQEGKRLAETSENFGITNHIKFRQLPREPGRSFTGRDIRPTEYAEERYIQRRLEVTDLAPGGKPGILVGANFPDGITGALASSLQIASGAAQVIHLAWDQGALLRQWGSPLARNNYLADYGLARLGGSRALVVLGLEKKFLREAEGTLEVFRLIEPEGGEARPIERPQ